MSRTRIRPREGVLLVCVLVCLLVSAAIIATTTRCALRARRSVQSEYQLRQTECLLDAGVALAMGQLQQSNDYQGEIWQAGSVGRFSAGRVEIRVIFPEPGGRSRQVEVVASLAAEGSEPSSSRSTTQRSHRFSIALVENPPVENSNNSESEPTNAE